MSACNAVQIRPFELPDQEAAKALILSGFAERFGFVDYNRNPDLNDIMSSYIQQGSVFIVAELDSQLVGTGGLRMESPQIARIVRLSVSACHRRLGIGRALVHDLLTRASQSGCRTVVLETNKEWEDAIRLYRRCGFVVHHRDETMVHMIAGL